MILHSLCFSGHIMLNLDYDRSLNSINSKPFIYFNLDYYLNMIPILSSSVNNLRPLGLNVYGAHCSDLLAAGCHFENLPVNIIVYIKQQKTYYYYY